MIENNIQLPVWLNYMFLYYNNFPHICITECDQGQDIFSPGTYRQQPQCFFSTPLQGRFFQCNKTFAQKSLINAISFACYLHNEDWCQLSKCRACMQRPPDILASAPLRGHNDKQLLIWLVQLKSRKSVSVWKGHLVYIAIVVVTAKPYTSTFLSLLIIV